MNEPDDQGEEEEAVMAPLVACSPVAPTVFKEIEHMFLRLGFGQAVVLKLVDDQGINSPWTLASLSDEDIEAICDVIHRPNGLVSGKTPGRGIKFLFWLQRISSL